ncbi:hypothetical protein T492DRAFT_993948 [Pavlovales sp. CCMP2436]|nr:hypothetical protein T492DRAFT_993948 [Pavlovales sp. CCMP2436]
MLTSEMKRPSPPDSPSTSCTSTVSRWSITPATVRWTVSPPAPTQCSAVPSEPWPGGILLIGNPFLESRRSASWSTDDTVRRCEMAAPLRNFDLEAPGSTCARALIWRAFSKSATCESATMRLAMRWLTNASRGAGTSGTATNAPKSRTVDSALDTATSSWHQQRATHRRHPHRPRQRSEGAVCRPSPAVA